ncbi:MAG: hypothetical protein LIQ31_06935, partial [Planctomycetes bacterium]|nr:hypothetical protein [Planctomycetota bacterium]
NEVCDNVFENGGGKSLIPASLGSRRPPYFKNCLHPSLRGGIFFPCVAYGQLPQNDIFWRKTPSADHDGSVYN